MKISIGVFKTSSYFLRYGLLGGWFQFPYRIAHATGSKNSPWPSPCFTFDKFPIVGDKGLLLCSAFILAANNKKAEKIV